MRLGDSIKNGWKIVKRRVREGADFDGTIDEVDQWSPERHKALERTFANDAILHDIQIHKIQQNPPNYGFMTPDNPRLLQEYVPDPIQDRKIRARVSTRTSNPSAFSAYALERHEAMQRVLGADKQRSITPQIPANFGILFAQTFEINNREYSFPFYGIRGGDYAQTFIQFGARPHKAMALMALKCQIDGAGQKWFTMDLYVHPEIMTNTLSSPFLNVTPEPAVLGHTYFLMPDPMLLGNPEKEILGSPPPTGSFWGMFNGGVSSSYSSRGPALSDLLALSKGIRQQQTEDILGLYVKYLKNWRAAFDELSASYHKFVPPDALAQRRTSAVSCSVYKHMIAQGIPLPMGVTEGDAPPTDGSVHFATRIMMEGGPGWAAEPG